MALFCHLSIFIFSIVLPAILYFAYKQKSRFVAFHALQALYYQVMMNVLLIPLGVLILLAVFLAGLDFDAFDSKPFSEDWILINTIVFGSIGLFFLIEYAYSVIMAVRSFGGNVSKYLIVGEWAYKKVYEKPFKTSYQTQHTGNRYSDVYSRDTDPFD